MPKRLVLCCDGTWNTAGQEREGRPCPTNVTKVALGVADRDADDVEQRVRYQEGLGVRPGERLRGGALAVGLSRNVQEVYRWIVDNYEPGDEIFFFGFSRGAYTARSTVGLIRNCGVLRREHAERLGAAYALYRSRSVRPADPESELFRRAYSHPARVRFIGVWDTVGSVGIPSVGFGIAELVNRQWGFHDTRLSRIVDAAYQALAIDEQRKSFRPAVWQPAPDAPGQQVEQVWFSGVHCDVGGGYADSSLADIALLWMVDRAQRSGLAFRDDAYRCPSRGGPREYDGRTYPVEPDPRGELHDSRKGIFRLQRAYSRPVGTHHPGTESVADSAVARHRDPDLGYAPRALVTCLQDPHGTTPVPVDWPPPESLLQPRAPSPQAETPLVPVSGAAPPGPGSPEIDHVAPPGPQSLDDDH